MNDIIWDIDGVLSDFTLAFKAFAAERFRIPVAPCGAKKSWDFRGLAPSEEDTLWRIIAAGDYDWSAQTSLVTPSDLIGIHALRSHPDVRYWYITSRLGPVPQVMAQTRNWLKGYGFPDWDNVYVSNDKLATIADYGLNPFALIDDDIRNVAAYLGVYGIGSVYLRDWQYNRIDEVRRVHGTGMPVFAACNANRVSSVSEFCYRVLEDLDGIDRG